MQFSVTATTLFFMGTIASFATNTDAQVINELFYRVLTAYVNPACEAVQDALNLTYTNCECAVSFGGLFRGSTGNVECVNTNRRCLQPPDEFCASGNVNFLLTAGIFVKTVIKSNITACYNVDEATLPIPVSGDVGTVCAEFSTAGFALDQCSITIGTESCATCTVCPSGADFKFDCSNIDLEKNASLGTVPGPQTETCIGFTSVGYARENNK